MSSNKIELSDKDMDVVLTKRFFLKVPDREGTFIGKRFSMSVKIGGVMQLSSVICRGEPVLRDVPGRGKVWCVDVFEYGVSGEVWCSKLRESVPVEEQHG